MYCVGDTIRFDYDGGSTPGQKTVKVTKVTDKLVYGVDLAKNQPRCYKRIDMICGTVVRPQYVKRVNFVEARQAIKSAVDTLQSRDLATLYFELVEGDSVSYNPDTGCIEVVGNTPSVEVKDWNDGCMAVKVNGVELSPNEVRKLLEKALTSEA